MTTLLRQHVNRLLKTSLENLPSKDGKEREFCFYGKMVDKSDLDKAESFCDQAQYRILVPAKEKGREIAVRIRKTISWYKNDKGTHSHDPVYHLTIKSFVKGEKGCSEAEVELPKDQGALMFDIFKLNGSDGLMKRRYFFPVGSGYFPEPKESANEKASIRMRFPKGMCWEVDVAKEFKDVDDLSRSEVDDVWAKLDLEVHDFDDLKLKDNRFELPFPIRLTEVIYEQVGDRSKENDALIKTILGTMTPIDN